MKLTKLNLGSGLDYRKGWINVDNNEYVKKDLVWDLDIMPYPFKQNTFTEIYASMVLGHLTHPAEVLKELIRIAKDGCAITIIVPHANSYANKTSITHKVNFTEYSFEPELIKQYGLSNNLFLREFRFIYKNKWKRYVPMKVKKLFNNMFDDLEFKFVVVKKERWEQN
ncbi:MAG: methyltransferase domain-containing protein [Nanoarchaeota archaeon]|nr:methyltransferase domain-containing protein [Nanoarchaeota archaeon]